MKYEKSPLEEVAELFNKPVEEVTENEILFYVAQNNSENIRNLISAFEGAIRTNERLIDIAENTQSRLDNLEDLIYSQLYEED